MLSRTGEGQRQPRLPLIPGATACVGYKVSPPAPFQPVTISNLSIIAHFSLRSPRASQPQKAHCPLAGYFSQGEPLFLIISKTITNTEHHRIGCDNRYNDGSLLREVEWSGQGRLLDRISGSKPWSSAFLPCDPGQVTKPLRAFISS